MSTVMIQIRNVPEPVHRRLKARAAEQGRSLSDYCLSELERIAARPTKEEMWERLSRLPPVDITTEEIVEAVRAERDAR